MTQTRTSSTTQDMKPSLEPLLTLVQQELEAVNALILRRLDSEVSLIPLMASHILAAGGKRLRPLLTIAAAKALGYTGNRHINLAACVEFIHTATLLHDDVVDASELRRGLPTANTLWGNEASVLVGDFLFSRAFELMVEDGSLDVLRLLSRASARIAEGEVWQLTTNGDLETTEEQYLKIVEAKTSALFDAACATGATLAGAGPEDIEAFSAYGRHLGIAFQIADDVLDYQGSAATMGKAKGDDFREGKMTLPVIHAVRHATEEEKAFWHRVMVDQTQQNGDLEVACLCIQRTGALEYAKNQACFHVDMAHKALTSITRCPTDFHQALAMAAQHSLIRGA
ncbi:MAG: polyprenyl synthetase family protein [Holosporales bacterium]